MATVCSAESSSAGRVKSLMPAITKPHLQIGAQKNLKEFEWFKFGFQAFLPKGEDGWPSAHAWGTMRVCLLQ